MTHSRGGGDRALTMLCYVLVEREEDRENDLINGTRDDVDKWARSVA